MTPQGIQACLVQMFNHGLITGMLFTLVGVVYDRVHTRDIDKFGGLASEMPLYTAFVGFAFMASLGLPGLSGFWGEAMSFIGAFPPFRALTMPSFCVTLKTTVLFGTGLPDSSLSEMTSGDETAVPTAAAWLLPETSVMCAAPAA